MCEQNIRYPDWSAAVITSALDTPVGQLAAERPGSVRVLEHFGIDYCCGGRTPLSQACALKGIDVRTVISALDSEASLNTTSARSEVAADTSLAELADQIVATHHDYLRREMPRLGGLLAKVVAAHLSRRPELREVEGVFAQLRDELECHMLKEEWVLFPIIKQLEAATVGQNGHSGSVHVPILMMEHEHAAAGAALERMSDLTNGYVPPADACNSHRALLRGLAELQSDLHVHIHKENNILFPRASALEAALRNAESSATVGSP
jgi:regulator of cell morphogenesis and NO signaling